MNMFRIIALMSAVTLCASMAIAQNSNPVSDAASTKEKFELGLEMLKGYRADLQDRLEKSAALLIIAIGWLITSDTARKSLAKQALLFWGGAITLTVLTIMYCLTIYHFIDRFQKIQMTVEGLAYVDPSYFSRYQMPNTLFFVPIHFSYILPVLFLYIFALLILNHIRRYSTS
jgi:hypothetical protein